MPSAASNIPPPNEINAQQNGVPRAPPDDRDLIDVMNDLQCKLVASGQSLDVDLPQIAVVGSQSAGKSSVLENIVGKEFLPRGSGVVTRRPTLIQLYPTTGEEYAVFGHRKGEKFYDFNRVKDEIWSQMPVNNGFSSVPIDLKIYSPRVLKLTLVDLPGIVKVPLDNQTMAHVREVREMVLRYIRQPESIILAVTPANQDLVTSDALEIAKEVDEQKKRTIGVLTKIDLMDAGTDARNILEQRMVKLERGFVGVVNRSQQEIEQGKDIQSTLERENKFFAEHPAYRHLKDRCGTPYLQRLLQKTLRARIKQALPELRNKLARELTNNETRLKALKEQLGEGCEDRQYYMIKQVNTFIEDITIKLMGNSELIDMKSLSPGAYINFQLNNEVQRNLNLRLVPNEEELTILVESMSGIKNSISVSSLVLDAQSKKLLKEYEEPLKESVQCVQRVLLMAIEESAEKLNSYKATKNEVLYRINRCVEKETEQTIEKLKEHLRAEMFYINLQHPDLDLTLCDQLYPAIGPSKVWESSKTETASTSSEATSEDAFASPVNGHLTDLSEKTKHLVPILMKNESIQRKVQYIMVLLAKYLEIVQKQIADLTIKYICCFLIKKVLDFIKIDLVPGLVSASNMVTLTEDCEEDFQEKERMETTSRILNEALNAIQHF